MAIDLIQPRLLNARKVGTVMAGAIYIGRPSKWGNQFVVGPGITRADAIRLHQEWVWSHPEVIEQIKAELCGQHLICWCAPRKCHGDILLAIANAEEFDW